MTTSSKAKKCAGCGKPSAYIGAASGTCPSCQNESVASLERELGLRKGELGRVNSRGEAK